MTSREMVRQVGDEDNALYKDLDDKRIETVTLYKWLFSSKRLAHSFDHKFS